MCYSKIIVSLKLRSYQVSLNDLYKIVAAHLSYKVDYGISGPGSWPLQGTPVRCNSRRQSPEITTLAYFLLGRQFSSSFWKQDAVQLETRQIHSQGFYQRYDLPEKSLMILIAVLQCSDTVM